MSAIIFQTQSAYDLARRSATHVIVRAKHIFVKKDNETYLSVKGPHSGKTLTARAVERIQNEDI